MDQRNAAKVLPEPVGAAIKVDLPAAIDCQPLSWGGVGFWKRSTNQRQTNGWNSTFKAVSPIGRRLSVKLKFLTGQQTGQKRIGSTHFEGCAVPRIGIPRLSSSSTTALAPALPWFASSAVLVTSD